MPRLLRKRVPAEGLAEVSGASMPAVSRNSERGHTAAVGEVREVGAAHQVGPARWTIFRTLALTLSAVGIHWRVLSRGVR